MAAPQYVPTPVADATRSYTSPDHVPNAWNADRPGDIDGRQPRGSRLGNPGPDQGFGIVLVRRFADKIRLQPGEHAEDAMAGALTLALKRASLFGRAPVIHDVTIAFTLFGFLDANPPAELVALRKPLFEGVSHVAHHYEDARAIADRVTEATLRMTPDQVAEAYPARWRDLVG